MSREIKFRAWSTIYEPRMYYLDPHGDDDWDLAEIKSTDNWVVMQYTGLKDKNGKEIYEGDIVKAASQGRHAVCEVKWGVATARFFLHREHGGLVWNLSGGGKDRNEETVEIIGNIYENPDLLEQSAA